jgi:hypothetical protein
MTKPFNVTVIEPPGYTHFALAEAAEYLHTQLVAVGQRARLSRNELDASSYNVIMCGQLLREHDAARLPADSIVFNSEQLPDADGWHFASGVYRRLLAAHHVWDYSPVNLPYLGHDRASVIPFLYCSELARAGRSRVPGDALVFYGVLTPYRLRVLEELRERGVAIEVVSAFGDLRDAWMFRARAVLNLHKSEDRSMFEPIRCFYPLINGVPVVSEGTTDPAADPFRDSMVFVDQLDHIATAAPLDPARFRATSREGTEAVARAVEAFLRATAGAG